MKRNVKGREKNKKKKKKVFENDFGRHSIYQQRKSNFAWASRAQDLNYLNITEKSRYL